MSARRQTRGGHPAFGPKRRGDTGTRKTRSGAGRHGGLTKDQVADLALQAKSHSNSFVMLPDYWIGYNYRTSLRWRTIRFNKTARARLPDTPGVYAFLAMPGVGRLKVAYLMYIGQTDSVRRRYREYQREASPQTRSRPKLYLMFRMYPDHLHFSYAPVPLTDCVPCEEALMTAFWPPVNHDLPATIRAARRAFES